MDRTLYFVVSGNTRDGSVFFLLYRDVYWLFNDSIVSDATTGNNSSVGDLAGVIQNLPATC